MQTIEQIIERILDEEGATYTDNPADSGGPTKYGVTQAALATWRGHPVTPDDVKWLLMDEAAKICRNRYFVQPGFDKVYSLSPDIAAKLTDAGYNCGTGTVSKFLQRALNVFNQGGKLYADVVVDGSIGAGTICALNAYLAKRGKEGETVMLRALNDLQGAYYIGLAEAREKDKEFVYGWVLNRVQ
jgi:lysozyme family protein